MTALLSRSGSDRAPLGSLFGIEAVYDKVYGFSQMGAVVEINNTDGSACLLACVRTMNR